MKDKKEKHPLIKIYYHLLIPRFLAYICVGLSLLTFVISFWEIRRLFISLFLLFIGGILWFGAKLLLLIIDACYFYFEEKGIKTHTLQPSENEDDNT